MDSAAGVESVFYDATTSTISPPLVKPLSTQSELESRNLWRKVTAAIDEKDYATAAKEKSVIEEGQRAAKKDREATGIEWSAAYFEPAFDDNFIEALRKTTNKSVEGLREGNLWAYKMDAAS